MIREFRVKPLRDEKKTKRIFLTLVLAAVFSFALSLLLPKYQGLVQIVSLVLLTAAIVLHNRYIGSYYTYELLIADDGTPLFLVKQITGKRISTFCRIALSDVSAITRESREEMKAHKTPAGYVKYTYTANLRPETVIRICSVSRYERCEIVIEGNDEFLSLLEDSVCEAKQLAEQNDE